MTLLLLFSSSFSIVFLLGFQSQLVRDKHVLASFITSLLIGTFQLILYKTAPNSDLLESVVFILGGAFGISSSIYAHNYWLKFYKRV